ncbi:MAG: hypothetical protein OHK0046_20750 [Anaerolineae bacterium]
MRTHHFEVVHQTLLDEMVIQRGLDHYNAAYGLAPMYELTAFARNPMNSIVGGIYGELNWGWLYIDLLWVDAVARRQHHGDKLVTAIEQAALARGVSQAFLATTSFQALPFYYHAGYRLFGVLENRPPGYNYYYLRHHITPVEGHHLPVDDEPDPDTFAIIRRGLADYNRSQGISPDGKRLAVYMRAADDHLFGGLIAATYWGWLDIQAFWLDKSVRDQGYGRQILQMAEEEAWRRGCHAAVVDVGSFQSLGFFEACGYTTFATLEDRPPGRTTHFMRKSLI